jgi:hypothetical protein
MSTGRYNACLSIFFVSYALFEPLTNVLLKRLKPSIFIPIVMYVPSRSPLPISGKLTLTQGDLGRVHAGDGICGKLVRFNGSPLVLGNGGSRTLSRSQLLLVMLVQAQ